MNREESEADEGVEFEGMVDDKATDEFGPVDRHLEIDSTALINGK